MNDLEYQIKDLLEKYTLSEILECLAFFTGSYKDEENFHKEQIKKSGKESEKGEGGDE